MIEPATVTALLEGERVQIVSNNQIDENIKSTFWITRFEVEGKEEEIFLILTGGEYFLMFAALVARSVHKKTLDSLPVEVLRTIIRVSSEVLLAKVVYQAESGLFIVTSECSVEGVTGKKLRNRLEACAKLTAKLELALA